MNKHERAKKAEIDSLAELHNVIRKLLREGERGTQADIARRTGYTRERLRQITKEGKP